jgi:hypothetical protein
MANDGSRSRTSFASSSVIVAVLLASGIYFFQVGAVLVGSCPAMADVSIQENAAEERIAGRRWQDPFAAIEKSFDKSDQRNLAPECLKTVSGSSARQSPLTEKRQEALVIGVMVPGAPYPEYAEYRSRTRFAVLAGLARTGFAPRNSSQPNYFLWPHPAWDKRPSTVAAQASSSAPSSLHSQAEPAWEEEATIAEPQETTIPYEWFEEVSNQSGEDTKNILVLWLNEEVFRGKPLSKLSQLKRFLYADKRVNRTDSGFRLLGPYSSAMLHDMVNETRKFNYAPPYDQAFGQLWEQDAWPDLKEVQFYAYGASAADDQLLGDLSATLGTVQHYFEVLGLHLQRTVATDRALARGLVSELKRRKVGLGSAGGDVALISEWDAYDGQSLPKAVELALAHTRPGSRRHVANGLNPDWIHNLTYLRGLDGPQTGNAQQLSGSNESAQGAKQVGATNIFKIQSDPRIFDRPMAQSQVDYLRRMSDGLHQLDEDLRREKRGIRAIGILGNNVFDKLLILRALRPQFPEALFFTTDFDEAFMMESELPWTRNLIVSSSFGLTLHKSIQRETPAFRGTYQTSAFLAMLLAIGDPAENWRTPPAVSDYISGQLLVSRIFEIERSGNVLSLAAERLPLHVASSRIPVGKDEQCPGNIDCKVPKLIAGAGSVVEGRSAVESGSQTITDWDCRKDADSTNCGDIQPGLGKLYPRFERSRQLTLGIGLAGGALLVLAALYVRILSKQASVEAWLVASGLAAAAAACAFWESLAQFLTEHGDGEPIALFQGVSVWPTVLLRGLGIVLAIYLVWRAQRSLRNNLAGIADEIRLDMTLPGSQDLRSVWNNIVAFFDRSRGHRRVSKPTSIEVETIWRSYVGQETFSRRFCRAFSYTAVAYLVVSLVVVPLFGNPSAPARGALATSAYFWTTFLYAQLMLFLTYFVFDATFCCLRFVRKLRRVEPQWPATTTSLFNDRPQPPGGVVRRWINLEFVERRTRCIGALIYYPVFLSALLIVTSSTAYANYPPNLSRFVAVGLSLAVVIAGAIALCREANGLRAAAKQNLQRTIISAKGNEVNRIEHGKGVIEKGAGGDRGYTEQLEFLLRQVELKSESAFGLFLQQPLVWAVFVLAGGFGWTILVETGMLPGI